MLVFFDYFECIISLKVLINFQTINKYSWKFVKIFYEILANILTYFQIFIKLKIMYLLTETKTENIYNVKFCLNFLN